MKWKGIVSQSRSIKITTTLAAAKAAHAISTQRLRTVEAIADTSHRLDHIGPQLRPETPHAHVHHVAAGIERIPPHVSEQALTRADLPVPPHQMLEEQELAFAEGHLTASGVRDAPRKIQGHAACVEQPLFRPGRGLAETCPDPRH